MKKLLALITILVMVSTNGFCEPEKNVEEDLGGLCPVTNIRGKVADCFKCHNEKTFTIKELIPFEEWDIPNHRSSMTYENGAPVGVVEVHGSIGGSEGSAMNEFIRYLHSSHKEVKKIILDIHSGGGSLFGGYQMVGIIKLWQSRGYTIETRINGFAASAAFFIFCAGEPRLVSPQAELMWHEIITFSLFDISGPADKEDQAAVLRHLQDTANHMIADISNLTKDELDSKIRKKEFWVNGIEAVEIGFATGLMN